MRERHAAMGFLAAFFRGINRFVPWHKLPYRILPKLSLRLWNLPALRYDLRRYNLYDTSSLPTRPRPQDFRPQTTAGSPLPDPFQPPAPFKPDDLSFRRADGSYNDLQAPRMGGACSRFGRNFPPEHSWPRDPLADPSPRDISNTLLARESFKPAESLNLLAAAWIQFMVHDWARHTPDVDHPEHRRRIALKPDDHWVKQGWTDTMEIEPTLPDQTRPVGCPAGPPTFLNEGTFWWDASQIYGSDAAAQRQLRAGVDGKLTVINGRLPDHPQLPGIDLTGSCSAGGPA